MTAPLTEAEIREALARAERATCLCHIWITRVHGFPQSHTLDCPKHDVPRLAADLLAAREERDEAVKAFMGLWEVSGDAIRAAKEPSLNPWIGEESWKKHIRKMAEIERTAALLSTPTPSPHTCQIHRATSGASDCGLEPCGEAVVHRDIGTPSPEPAVEDMTRAEVQAELAARGIDVAPAVDRVLVALRAAHYADPRQCPNKVSRGGENVCGCPAPVEEDTMAHEDADPQILGIDVVLDPNCPIDTLTLVGTDKDGKPVNAGRIVGLRTAHPAPVEAKCGTCDGSKWTLDPPHTPDCDTPVPAGMRDSHRLVWCKCGARGHECPDCGGGA